MNNQTNQINVPDESIVALLEQIKAFAAELDLIHKPEVLTSVCLALVSMTAALNSEESKFKLENVTNCDGNLVGDYEITIRQISGAGIQAEPADSGRAEPEVTV